MNLVGNGRRRRRSPSCCPDEEVEAPRMKRIKRKPCIGQMRLQSELECGQSLRPGHVCTMIQTEKLRARFSIATGSEELPRVEFEFEFPNHYPHKPPRIRQLRPDNTVLKCFRYDEHGFVQVDELEETLWRPVMGITNVLAVLADLIEGMIAASCSNPSAHDRPYRPPTAIGAPPAIVAHTNLGQQPQQEHRNSALPLAPSPMQMGNPNTNSNCIFGGSTNSGHHRTAGLKSTNVDFMN